MKFFENLSDVDDLLEKFNEVNETNNSELDTMMTDEMKASQRRYEEYILKHTEQDQE